MMRLAPTSNHLFRGHVTCVASPPNYVKIGWIITNKQTQTKT